MRRQVFSAFFAEKPRWRVTRGVLKGRTAADLVELAFALAHKKSLSASDPSACFIWNNWIKVEGRMDYCAPDTSVPLGRCRSFSTSRSLAIVQAKPLFFMQLSTVMDPFYLLSRCTPAIYSHADQLP